MVLWVGNNSSEEPDSSIFMLELKMQVADSSPPTTVHDVDFFYDVKKSSACLPSEGK
jgi:hypothetical protein